jgi:hypothetical protein
MKMSPRNVLLGLATFGLLGFFAFLDSKSEPQPLAAAPPPLQPLDRVPADAGLFAHLNAGNIWDHPTVAQLRKTYGKELEGILKTVETETGLRPEQLQSATFHYPKIPTGPGDETLFVLQIVTKKPYDKDTLLSGFRPKGEMAKGDVIKLENKMLVHLTSDTQFTVLHETLLEDFKKGSAQAKEGLQTEAIAAAKTGKNSLVVGLDPSQLPAEIFDNAPPELQPFLPLLKSKSIVLTANLDKDLSAEVRFLGENEDKSIEAERAFNLLMKLADDAITTVLKEEKVDEDLKPLLPALADLQKVVQTIKAQRKGNVTSAKVSIKPDPALAGPIVGIFVKPQMAAARARSSNNLKQIGLALHNYHDTYGVLPASAIVDKKGKPLLSWRVAILPYIEQDNLYKKFKLDEPWDSENNLPLSKVRIRVYELPYGEPKPGITNYRAFVGNGAAFDAVQGFKLDQFTDGTSNTMLAFEAAEGVPWSKPDDIEFDPAKPVLKHLRFENGKSCMILLADGSVRAISNTVKEETLKLFIQKDDGKPIGDID